MKTTTGPQCQKYFDTGKACPGCEQCAPLSVQAKNEVPMRLPADLHLDLRDAVAVARQRAEKLGNAAMKKRWDAVDERLYAMSLSAAPAAQVQAQPEPHQWTLDTIGGAIAYGRMGATPPPSPEHWLNEYWQIGRQLAKLDETSAWDNVTPADAAAQAQPVAGDKLLQRWASWMVINRPEYFKDHACKRCTGFECEMTVDGFSCVYHEAKDVLGGCATQPAAASESVDLQALRKLAMAATPGEWEAKPLGRVIGGPLRHYTNGSCQAQIASFSVTFHDQAPEDEPERQQANADFCAAANPAMILRLLDAIAANKPAAPAAEQVAPEVPEGLLSWAVERWNNEVADRPLKNVHRRTLDDTWRQVIRFAGGDPDVLVGPSHDELIAASPNTGSQQ